MPSRNVKMFDECLWDTGDRPRKKFLRRTDELCFPRRTEKFFAEKNSGTLKKFIGRSRAGVSGENFRDGFLKVLIIKRFA